MIVEVKLPHQERLKQNHMYQNYQSDLLERVSVQISSDYTTRTCLGMYFPFSLRILLRIKTWLEKRLTMNSDVWRRCLTGSSSVQILHTCQKLVLKLTSCHSGEEWRHNDESRQPERWWRRWATRPKVGYWSLEEAPVQPCDLVADLEKRVINKTKEPLKQSPILFPFTLQMSLNNRGMGWKSFSKLAAKDVRRYQAKELTTNSHK